jgi:hypothetical protein
MNAPEKARKKTVHEAFTRFFENPTRETFRGLLLEHVGELRECDFKESWPANAAVAKHLLGLANSGGGCLVVGVQESEDGTLIPKGISALKDKADLVSGTQSYLPQPVLDSLECGDFSYDAPEYASLVGKRFQVVFVHGRPAELPFVALVHGEGIRAGAIYVRREGSTNEATYEEVQRLIAQRIAAVPQTPQARDLKTHLEELKVLYAEIPRNLVGMPPLFRSLGITEIAQQLVGTWAGDAKHNPNFPPEDYQSFVRRLVDSKKRLIEEFLGLAR